MQDNGNLVLYNAAKQAIWTRYMILTYLRPGQILKPGIALFSQNRRFKFVMQSDGNLVLYKAGTQRLWNYRTNRPCAIAAMQHDGNFVIYIGKQALWSTRTNKAGSLMIMQNDGNVVIYYGRTPVWSTKTGGA